MLILQSRQILINKTDRKETIMKKQFSALLLAGGLLAGSLALVSHAVPMPGMDAGMILNQAMREQQMRATTPYMFSPFSTPEVIQWKEPTSGTANKKVSGKVVNSNLDPLFNQALDNFQSRNYTKAI